MPKIPPVRRSSALALCGALAVALGAIRVPAWAQEPPPPDPSTTSTTTIPLTPDDPTSTSTTSTTVPPEDPGAVEELPAEPVPVVADTVPPTPPGEGAYAAQAGQIFRRELRVAKAESIGLESAFTIAKQRVVAGEGRQGHQGGLGNGGG
jgi:hypothetical protein